MRSLRSACLALALSAGAAAAWPAGAVVSPEQVAAAASAVRADPLLGTTRSERQLRWKAEQSKAAPPPDGSGAWLISLVRWLAESARWLMWLIGAIAVALLLVLLRRWMLVRADSVRGRPVTLPSHVRDLDIRPASLPDDVPAAARALWQRGEQRACLSLLYRGALSRLVHGHAVPIRAASTEGECVALARQAMDAERSSFFDKLVQAWLLSVYGAREPSQAEVMSLCDEFDRRLPAAAAGVRAAA